MSQQTPRISVRLAQEHIDWLTANYASVTQGIHAAVQTLRGVRSLVPILRERFEHNESITVGALLARVNLTYNELFAILEQAREQKAIKISRGAISGRVRDLDMTTYAVSVGKNFEQWSAHVGS